jgi:hypothetical protein
MRTQTKKIWPLIKGLSKVKQKKVLAKKTSLSGLAALSCCRTKKYTGVRRFTFKWPRWSRVDLELSAVASVPL